MKLRVPPVPADCLYFHLLLYVSGINTSLNWLKLYLMWHNVLIWSISRNTRRWILFTASCSTIHIPFHIFSCNKHKLFCVLSGFHVINQHKVTNRHEVEGKERMVLNIVAVAVCLVLSCWRVSAPVSSLYRFKTACFVFLSILHPTNSDQHPHSCLIEESTQHDAAAAIFYGLGSVFKMMWRFSFLPLIAHM